jgi:hypothetical protein
MSIVHGSAYLRFILQRRSVVPRVIDSAEEELAIQKFSISYLHIQLALLCKILFMFANDLLNCKGGISTRSCLL